MATVYDIECGLLREQITRPHELTDPEPIAMLALEVGIDGVGEQSLSAYLRVEGGGFTGPHTMYYRTADLLRKLGRLP